MIAVNPVHVDIWETYITTPILTPHYADIWIATTVNNHSGSDNEIRIKHKILTEEENQVGESKIVTIIEPDEQKIIEITITISNPRRWDIENPHIYTLITEIYQGEELLDKYNLVFGVRDIRFTADNGFYLNDKRI